MKTLALFVFLTLHMYGASDQPLEFGWSPVGTVGSFTGINLKSDYTFVPEYYHSEKGIGKMSGYVFRHSLVSVLAKQLANNHDPIQSVQITEHQITVMYKPGELNRSFVCSEAIYLWFRLQMLLKQRIDLTLISPNVPTNYCYGTRPL